jgi:seryl-tRNA synthetase
MLLNELQKQHATVATQQDELQSQLQQIKTQQQMQAQRQEIDSLNRQLRQQNASLQERLTKLESYVETQIKTASDTVPRTPPPASTAVCSNSDLTRAGGTQPIEFRHFCVARIGNAARNYTLLNLTNTVAELI